jgi:hypothetical protein
VSLLDRLGRTHLSDATLARLWADGASAHPHLETCAACRDRAVRFDAWLTGIADDMVLEADQVMGGERLGVQQAQIARRLEALDRPARVIAFPKAARAVISGHSHVRRWVTVAAAASLIAGGFGLGQVMPLRRELRRPSTTTAAAPLTLPRTAERAHEIAPVVNSINEDELLSNTFVRSRVSTLNALDDMTPHARDMVLSRRGK